jgi:hypothetical protein
VLAPSTAQAAPVVPAPAAPITHFAEPALTPGTLHLGNLPLEIWWLGNGPNPNQQGPTTTILSIKPITLLPGFIQPFFGWFSNLNLSACIAGVGVHVGPYGTVSASISRTC